MTPDEAKERFYRRWNRHLNRTLQKLRRRGAMPTAKQVVAMLPPEMQQQLRDELEREDGEVKEPRKATRTRRR